MIANVGDRDIHIVIAVVLQLVAEVDVFIGIIGMFKGDVHLARQAGVAHKGLPDVASSNLLGIIGVDVGAAFPLDVVHFGGNKRVGAAAFQRYVRDIRRRIHTIRQGDLVIDRLGMQRKVRVGLGRFHYKGIVRAFGQVHRQLGRLFRNHFIPVIHFKGSGIFGYQLVTIRIRRCHQVHPLPLVVGDILDARQAERLRIVCLRRWFTVPSRCFPALL